MQVNVIKFFLCFDNGDKIRDIGESWTFSGRGRIISERKTRKIEVDFTKIY